MDYVSCPIWDNDGPLSGNQAVVFILNKSNKFVLHHLFGCCMLPHGFVNNVVDSEDFGFVGNRFMVGDHFVQDPHVVSLNLRLMAGMSHPLVELWHNVP